jgi:antitoxin PrlF
MASMRVPVTITRRGAITLPAKLRQALGLKPDDRLIAEITPDGLLLRPSVTLPLELYTGKRVREFDEAEAELAIASVSDASPRLRAAPARTPRPAGRRR